MSFASLTYIGFLIATCAIYWVLPHRFRWTIVMLASYIFYASWHTWYVGLLLCSTVLAYLFGKKIAQASKQKDKKIYLTIGLILQVVLLGYFKYTNFILDIIGNISSLITQNPTTWSLMILLPIGISFYIFQCISYQIDVYRDKRDFEPHFGYFASYICFFPQLVAGPIERSNSIIPQLKSTKKLTEQDWFSGWKQILWGMLKKIVIADQAGFLADHYFSASASQSGWGMLLGTYLFAIQIYADFSGYSDIAIGSGKLFGIKLSKNFDSPYLATSITDFWRRWHITLMTWFRDYIYIPLGGNRSKHYRNIFLVFLISGIWHGAAYTFVVWGVAHGLLVAIEHLQKKEKLPKLSLPSWASILITFHLVCLLWIPFRADTLSGALDIVTSIAKAPFAMETLSVIDPSRLSIVLTFFVIMLVGEWWQSKKDTLVIDGFGRSIRWTAMIAAVIAIVFFGNFGESPFIYFQF